MLGLLSKLRVLDLALNSLKGQLASVGTVGWKLSSQRGAG
jgi:hypothetical protein